MSAVGTGALPDRDPRKLLEALLTRFADASDPRDPARALLAVASPRFASRAGDATHLAHLFGNAAWAPLIGHASAQIGEVAVLDDAARVTIVVRAADGTTASYLASLRRDEAAEAERDDQADGAGDVWRVTGLVRSELADA